MTRPADTGHRTLEKSIKTETQKDQVVKLCTTRTTPPPADSAKSGDHYKRDGSAKVGNSGQLLAASCLVCKFFKPQNTRIGADKKNMDEI